MRTPRIRVPQGLGEFVGFAGSTVLMQVVRVVAGLVAARVLGPATWGEWYVLNLVLAYGAVTHLGALNAMSRDVPAALGRGDASLSSRLASTSLSMTLVGSVLGAAFVASLAALVPLGVEASLVALVGALLIGQQLYTFVVANLRARVKFPAASRLQLVLSGAYFVCAVAGVLAFGLWGFVLGMLVAYAVTVGTGWRYLQGLRPSLDRDIVRRLVASGLPILLVGVANTVFTTVDRWIVLGRLGQYELGLYSLAIMALNAMALLPQVVSQQVYPRIAFAWAKNGSVPEVEQLVRRQRVTAQGLMIPITVAASVVLPPLVARFLPEYVEAVPALLVTLLTPLVASFGQGYSAVLHVLGRQSWYLAAVIAAAVLNVVLSLVLIAPLGLVGVATATLASNGFLAGLRVVMGAAALRRAARDAQGSDVMNPSIAGR